MHGVKSQQLRDGEALQVWMFAKEGQPTQIVLMETGLEALLQ
jgi:hypothetical protein